MIQIESIVYPNTEDRVKLIEQISEEYEDLFNEAYAFNETEKYMKVYNKIADRYGSINANGAMILRYIKKYPGRSVLGGLAAMLAGIACAVAVPGIGMIINIITAYTVGSCAGMALGSQIVRMTDDEYDEFCKQLDKELDKREANQTQRRSAHRLASATKRAINKRAKAVQKEKGIKTTRESVEYDLIEYLF